MARQTTKSNVVDISGLDKVDVLCALYAKASPLGMGSMQYEAGPLDRTEAAAMLQVTTSFDYLKGRVMKIDLGADSLRTALYNRDNGYLAAEGVIAQLRSLQEQE